MTREKTNFTHKTAPVASGVPVYCAHDEIVILEDLQPNPQNPNKHDEEQLRIYGKIIRTNGWRRAIVVSTRSGFITKGHGAWLAARQEGLEYVPVNFQDYATEEAEIEDMLADNELARLSKNNKAELNKLIGQLEAKGVDIELAGILKQIEEEGETLAPQYPITAKLNERHDYVLIFTDNESDFVFLQNLCGAQIERSYKKTGIGVGRCVPFNRFLKAIRENYHSLNVQGGHDDNAQAGKELPGVRARQSKK